MIKCKMPKVSIITVVYNGEKELENTILSVIRQTYDNLEYIIVDGGSTDNTINIIKKYANKISYWISEPDKGIYDAMNKGIDVANGEWLLFRNCGDYFSSLSDIARVFENTNYNDYDVIYGDAIVWDKYGFKKEKPEIQKFNRYGVMPVWHPSTFVRTSLHKKIKFDLKYKLAADHNFIINCKWSGIKFKYIPIILSIFNIGDGASVKGQIKSRKEHFYIYGGDANRWNLFIFNIQLLKVNMVLYLRRYIPDAVMRMRRKMQGRVIWKENYTINDMISNALSRTEIKHK